MKLSIKLFAGLADQLQTSELILEMDATDITVRQLKAELIRRYPEHASSIELSFIAKNQAYASADEPIRQADEIAVIPPVSGGRPVSPEGQGDQAPNYEITYEPIAMQRVADKVADRNHGAALVFIGTTREYTLGKRTTLLEYEGYVPMALRTLEQIGNEIAERWPGTRCAITHRLGRVDVGEISVVIAVSSPHRSDSYQASQYAIERLKQIVPIWKKEIWEDGSQWKGPQTGPWNPTAPLDQDRNR